VRSDRENLACLRVRDGVITLERMFFDDEVRSMDGIAPSSAKVDKRQLEMARDLIGAYTAEEFDISKYEDTYRERLLEVIERKRLGKTTKPKAATTEEKPPDLMAALTASLDQAREAKKSSPKAKSSGAKSTRARPKAAAARRKTA
jgi:DNA end-binding protein Ku